jgi:hypothetical protein
MLLAFIFFFVAYISILQWKIPYQYYYARYLVSEALPYIILFTVTALATIKKGKSLYLLLLVLAGVYATHFSIVQNRGNVADGTYESLKEVTRNIDKDDLILTKDIGAEVKMALVYYEDKNVISFQSEELDFLTGETLSKYNDIFVLSWDPYQHKALIPENEVTYRFGLFEHADEIPEKYYYIIKNLYLYKLDKKKWISFLMNSKKKISIKVSPVNREGFFTNSVWTTDSAKIDGFDFNISDLGYLKLDVYGNNPIYDYNPDKMGLEIFLNGKKLKYHSQKEGSLYFEIDHQGSAQEITIHTKTFVPKSYQINEDDRALGIDIKSISFIKEIKQ